MSSGSAQPGAPTVHQRVSDTLKCVYSSQPPRVRESKRTVCWPSVPLSGFKGFGAGEAALEFSERDVVVFQHRSERPSAVRRRIEVAFAGRACVGVYREGRIGFCRWNDRCGIVADTDGPRQDHPMGRPPRSRPPCLGHLFIRHAERWIAVFEALPIVQQVRSRYRRRWGRPWRPCRHRRIQKVRTPAPPSQRTKKLLAIGNAIPGSSSVFIPWSVAVILTIPLRPWTAIVA